MAPAKTRSGMTLLLGAVLAVAGCGGTQGGASSAAEASGAEPSGAQGSPEAAGSAVAVTLQEWAVVPDANSVAAGPVTFSVTNSGPEDVHEFVILRTDLDPGALPTEGTGAVSEDAEGIEVVDEIEDVAIGATEQVSATLTPGKYVLLCNVYSEEEKEAHYQLGMRTAFTVTE